MQVRAKVNVKHGDKFYNKGDLLDVPYMPDEQYFEEVVKQEPEVVKEVVTPKKRKLAK